TTETCPACSNGSTAQPQATPTGRPTSPTTAAPASSWTPRSATSGTTQTAPPRSATSASATRRRGDSALVALYDRSSGASEIQSIALALLDGGNRGRSSRRFLLTDRRGGCG